MPISSVQRIFEMTSYRRVNETEPKPEPGLSSTVMDGIFKKVDEINLKLVNREIEPSAILQLMKPDIQQLSRAHDVARLNLGGFPHNRLYAGEFAVQHEAGGLADLVMDCNQRALQEPAPKNGPWSLEAIAREYTGPDREQRTRHNSR